MPPKPLLDLSTVDLSRVAYDAGALDTYLPQRDLMRQLHGVFVLDRERGFVVGYRDVRDDEFWCKGHFPGQPVFPGVLLVETVAQLCAFYWRACVALEQCPTRVMLFGGIDEVKFRDAVFPGQRVVVVAQVQELKVRRSSYQTQALVGGKLVFSGTITGLLGPEMPGAYGS